MTLLRGDVKLCSINESISPARP